MKQNTKVLALLSKAATIFLYLHLALFTAILILNHFDPFNAPIDVTIRGHIGIYPEKWRPEEVTSIGYFQNQKMLIYRSGFMRFDYTAFSQALTAKNVKYFLADNCVKVLWLIITILMRNIFVSLAKGQIFDGTNLWRVRKVALCLFFIPFCEFLAYQLFVPIVRSEVEIEGFNISIYRGFNESMIGIALLVLALGEVFRYGMQLQEQNDLTI